MLAVQPLGGPPLLQPGHQAAGRAPRLQRSLRLPSPPRLLAKGRPAPAAAKFSHNPGGKRPRDEERAAARPPSAAGHVEGESRLLPRDAGSPPMLLPPPAPLAPLTLTRGFTLASKPEPRPSRAAGAASARAAADVGGAAAAQPTACAVPTWGADASRPRPMLAFAPPTSRGLCWPGSPPTSLRPSSASASCALREPRCPRSCGTRRPANGERSDAEIGKPPPKVGGKESGEPGCQSK